MADHPAFYSNPNATVHSVAELNALDSTVETIIVDNNGCNDRSFTVLNLTRFVNLRVLEIGDYSFSYVDEVYLIGLDKLERVLIGEKCFTLYKNTWEQHPNGEFHLKDCERLRELRIGGNSFYDYTVCEIENVDSLEVIEMDSSVYYYFTTFRQSNFELRSLYHRIVMMTRHAEVEITGFCWCIQGVFSCCV